MRKLVWCELYKLKRSKSLLLLTSLALLFPAALTVFTKSSLADAASTADFHAFYDNLVNYTLAYGAMLLPCLFGCVGAPSLLFGAGLRQPSKICRAIPVTRNQLIFAKLGVLYLWSELYALCSGLAVTLFCFVLEPRTLYDVPFKLVCFLLAGITMATVSLPVVVLVIYRNQSYLLSLLLSFLYAVVNWLLLILFASMRPFPSGCRC